MSFLSCNSICETGFNGQPVKIYQKGCVLEQLKLLQSKFSYNKNIPKECELQTLVALSFFPELYGTAIDFVYSDIKTTMESRPKSISALRNGNRNYVILIDTKVESNNGILFKEVPFNAQIGLIGHELSHIVSYKVKTRTELFRFGFSYFNGQKSAIERGTDHFTIGKGLGWQLYDWSDYVFNKSNASKSYKDFKELNYMSPKEIMLDINCNHTYLR